MCVFKKMNAWITCVAHQTLWIYIWYPEPTGKCFLFSLFRGQHFKNAKPRMLRHFISNQIPCPLHITFLLNWVLTLNFDIRKCLHCLNNVSWKHVYFKRAPALLHVSRRRDENSWVWSHTHRWNTAWSQGLASKWSFVHSHDFWLPGHQVNITLKKLSWRSHPATIFLCILFKNWKFSDLKAEFSNFMLL